MSVSDPCPVEGCDRRAAAPAVLDGETVLMCDGCAVEAMADQLDDAEVAQLAAAGGQ